MTHTLIAFALMAFMAFFMAFIAFFIAFMAFIAFFIAFGPLPSLPSSLNHLSLFDWIDCLCLHCLLHGWVGRRCNMCSCLGSLAMSLWFSATSFSKFLISVLIWSNPCLPALWPWTPRQFLIPSIDVLQLMTRFFPRGWTLFKKTNQSLNWSCQWVKQHLTHWIRQTMQPSLWMGVPPGLAWETNKKQHTREQKKLRWNTTDWRTMHTHKPPHVLQQSKTPLKHSPTKPLPQKTHNLNSMLQSWTQRIDWQLPWWWHPTWCKQTTCHQRRKTILQRHKLTPHLLFGHGQSNTFSTDRLKPQPVSASTATLPSTGSSCGYLRCCINGNLITMTIVVDHHPHYHIMIIIAFARIWDPFRRVLTPIWGHGDPKS